MSMRTVILLLCVLSVMAPALAAVYTKTEERDGKRLVVLGNDAMELTFDPARGGRCVRFVFKDTGEQIIGNNEVDGMFIDHWAKYTWPSGLLWLPYECQIVGDGKREAGVRLWVKVPALGGGKGSASPASSLQQETSPDLIGLIMRKTLWLRSDSNLIRVEHEIENPTAESRAPALFVQHNLMVGGDRYHDTWYLPSTRGVEWSIQPDQAGARSIGPDWVLDPTAGWMAVRDRKSGRGLLFAFDYDYLQKIYTCGQTAEWFFEPVPIGPGKTFRTEHVIKPVQGFEGFAYGSRRLAADIAPKEVAGGVKVALDLAAVDQPLRDVTVEVQVTGWKSKQRVATQTFKLPQLGLDRKRQGFTFKPQALADGVVIAAVVRAGKQEERFEVYYAGDRAEHERRYGYFANRGGALAGAKGDAYFLKQPRKHKVFDKPDFAKVARPDPARCRVLVVFGLYTHILNLDDALASWRNKAGKAPEFDWANCPPNAVETFPGTYDELFRYDAVVLSDVNYRALGDIAFEMICDYVAQGGKLLVVGGPYAFGNGEFEETRFLEVLPVTLGGPFDLKWAGKGQSWELTPARAGHPVLQGLSFAAKPRVFWHHFVTPKAGADVVLKAGEKPALILGKYGKGKVAVFALSPTGLGAQGETQWWDWDGWFPLVRNVMTWFTQEQKEARP